jgi:hypothetical protein
MMIALLLSVGMMFTAAKPKATVMIDCTGVPDCSVAMLDVKSIHLVQKYATDHDTDVTVIPRNGYWWIEADGLDAHGTGKTIEEAAEDFLYTVDMMDHEPAPAKFVCPEKDYCI